MKVLSYPNSVLSYKCKPIAVINQQLRDLVAAMFQVMYSSNGVGLAANQVGYPLQLFVMNETGNSEKTENEYVLINPVISRRKGNQIDQEGCLSFPGVSADVNRAKSIEIESIAIDGSVQFFKWIDRQARIAQHEYDHLNGINFVDRLTESSLDEIRDDLDELQINHENDIRLGFVLSDQEIQNQIAELEKQFCE
ncbi:MAG: peptide deformylase [Planctomycetaceae bacterium]|nr:peptide deformylase [Planctomycetaceae bacterium]